jgi:hypothetical protein
LVWFLGWGGGGLSALTGSSPTLTVAAKGDLDKVWIEVRVFGCDQFKPLLE